MAELLFTASVDRMIVDHDLSPRLFKSQRGRITQHTYRTLAPRSDIGRRSAPFHPLWSHGPVSVQQWTSAVPSRNRLRFACPSIQQTPSQPASWLRAARAGGGAAGWRCCCCSTPRSTASPARSCCCSRRRVQRSLQSPAGCACAVCRPPVDAVATERQDTMTKTA